MSEKRNENGYIEELIAKTKALSSCTRDQEIIDLYHEIQNVFNSNEYSKEEKEILHKNALLEVLALFYEGENE